MKTVKISETAYIGKAILSATVGAAKPIGRVGMWAGKKVGGKVIKAVKSGISNATAKGLSKTAIRYPKVGRIITPPIQATIAKHAGNAGAKLAVAGATKAATTLKDKYSRPTATTLKDKYSRPTVTTLKDKYSRPASGQAHVREDDFKSRVAAKMSPKYRSRLHYVPDSRSREGRRLILAAPAPVLKRPTQRQLLSRPTGSGPGNSYSNLRKRVKNNLPLSPEQKRNAAGMEKTKRMLRISASHNGRVHSRTFLSENQKNKNMRNPKNESDRLMGRHRIGGPKKSSGIPNFIHQEITRPSIHVIGRVDTTKSKPLKLPRKVSGKVQLPKWMGRKRKSGNVLEGLIRDGRVSKLQETLFRAFE